MKLLIYTHEFPPFLGGLATTSRKLARGISQSDMDIVVLAPAYSSEDSIIDAELTCKVTRIPGLGKKWVKKIPFLEIVLGWICLLQTLSKEQPDSVIFITEEAEVVGGLLPLYNFNPIVRIAGSGITTCFYGRNFFKRLMRFPMKRLYDKAVKIIAVSNNTKELIQSVGVPEDKIEVVYNGVEDYMLSKEADVEAINRIRDRYGILEADKVLVTVARVLPRKGQDTVIKALPRVLTEFPDLKYLIVGDGRYRDKFSDLAKEIDVSDNVIFTGGVSHDETISYFDLCDIFIMPNRFWNNKVEGLPNALIEASARSKPLIAGDHGGSKEAVINNKTGILVNPESADDVAHAILSILRDEKTGLEMGKLGRENIINQHTELTMIANYISAIKRASQ